MKLISVLLLTLIIQLLLPMVLLLTLFLIGCEKPKSLPERYSVTYEILYPTGSKEYTIQTEKGKAKVGTYVSGFFHTGPLIYYLEDSTRKTYDKEQFPIRIKAQNKIN